LGFIDKVQRAQRVFAALGWPAESNADLAPTHPAASE
jgi:hypothetical protein